MKIWTNGQEKSSQDWAELASWLAHIELTAAFPLRLEVDRTSLEVRGLSHRLGVWWSQDGQQAIIGLAKRKESPTHIQQGNEQYPLQENELMQWEDALLLMECLAKGRPFPDAYHLRLLQP
ncbi:MAG: hypothetical protein AAFR61_20535 [Bacteroidota bacterium]